VQEVLEHHALHAGLLIGLQALGDLLDSALQRPVGHVAELPRALADLAARRTTGKSVIVA
jgi:hypothetical protein